PGAVDRCTFRRGFPDEVSLSAAAFLEYGPRLAAAGPVRVVNLFEIGPRVGELAAAEALAGLTGLGLAGNRLGDRGVAVLAGSALLPRMLARSRALDLSRNEVSARGLQALLACPRLVPLASLNLSGNGVGDAGLIALTVADWLPN